VGATTLAPGAPGIWCPPPSGAAISRSVVVDDALYTLSSDGLKTSALADLGDRSWLPFA
jgi:hypothetical protein